MPRIGQAEIIVQGKREERHGPVAAWPGVQKTKRLPVEIGHPEHSVLCDASEIVEVEATAQPRKIGEDNQHANHDESGKKDP